MDLLETTQEFLNKRQRDTLNDFANQGPSCAVTLTMQDGRNLTLLARAELVGATIVLLIPYRTTATATAIMDRVKRWSL